MPQPTTLLQGTLDLLILKALASSEPKKRRSGTVSPLRLLRR
jgi:hypothetical protein